MLLRYIPSAETHRDEEKSLQVKNLLEGEAIRPNKDGFPQQEMGIRGPGLR